MQAFVFAPFSEAAKAFVFAQKLQQQKLKSLQALHQ